MKPVPYIPVPDNAHWRCWALKIDGKRCKNKRSDKNERGDRWFTCAAHREIEEDAKLLAEKAGWFNARL